MPTASTIYHRYAHTCQAASYRNQLFSVHPISRDSNTPSRERRTIENNQEKDERATLILLRRLLTKIVRPLTSLALSVPVPCLSLSRKKSGPLLVRDSGGGVGLGCKRFDSSGAGILEKCDVWCLFVWVMTRGPRFISEILNHRTVGLRKILPDPESLDQ